MNTTSTTPTAAAPAAATTPQKPTTQYRTWLRQNGATALITIKRAIITAYYDLPMSVYKSAADTADALYAHLQCITPAPTDIKQKRRRPRHTDTEIITLIQNTASTLHPYTESTPEISGALYNLRVDLSNLTHA